MSQKPEKNKASRKDGQLCSLFPGDGGRQRLSERLSEISIGRSLKAFETGVSIE